MKKLLLRLFALQVFLLLLSCTSESGPTSGNADSESELPVTGIEFPECASAPFICVTSPNGVTLGYLRLLDEGSVDSLVVMDFGVSGLHSGTAFARAIMLDAPDNIGLFVPAERWLSGASDGCVTAIQAAGSVEAGQGSDIDLAKDCRQELEDNQKFFKQVSAGITATSERYGAKVYGLGVSYGSISLAHLSASGTDFEQVLLVAPVDPVVQVDISSRSQYARGKLEALWPNKLDSGEFACAPNCVELDSAIAKATRQLPIEIAGRSIEFDENDLGAALYAASYNPAHNVAWLYKALVNLGNDPVGVQYLARLADSVQYRASDGVQNRQAVGGYLLQVCGYISTGNTDLEALDPIGRFLHNLHSPCQYFDAEPAESAVGDCVLIDPSNPVSVEPNQWRHGGKMLTLEGNQQDIRNVTSAAGHLLRQMIQGEKGWCDLAQSN